MSTTDKYPIFSSNLPVNAITGFLEVNRHDSFSSDRKLRFLKFFRESQNISKSAQAVGITREVVVYHLKADKAFKTAFDGAIEAMCDELENVMVDHAHSKQGFLDRIAFLKAKRAEVWDKRRDDQPIQININMDTKALEAAKMREKALEAEIVEPKTLEHHDNISVVIGTKNDDTA
jgi:hypothetical protein